MTLDARVEPATRVDVTSLRREGLTGMQAASLTYEQAEELLHTLPASSVPEPRLMVQTSERTVSWGGERSVRI